MNPKKTRAETWDAAHGMAVEDDMAEILAMSDEELDREIEAAGGDPKAIGEAGAALVERLAKRRLELSWQTDVALAEKEYRDHKTEIVARRVPRSRAELQARIEAARQDPRFSAPVAALFRDRSKAEPTDEELQVFVEHLEILERLFLAKKPE